MHLIGRKNHQTIRDFRAHLKAHLSGTHPLTLGDYYHVRAIVIPIPAIASLHAAEKRRAFAALRRDAVALINQLRWL